MLKTLTLPFARASTRSRPPSKLVAIVVPLSSRPGLTAEEQISLRQFQHHLGASPHDKFLLAPPYSTLSVPGFEVKRYPAKYFGSVAAHNLLLYSPGFYRQFSDYKYIFFYHLDSLVFSNQLDEWCATDIDYIGPPWITCPDTPWVKRPRVGNGGFGLLKVRSALDVLYGRYRAYPGSFWLDILTRNQRELAPFISLLRALHRRFPRSRVLRRPLQEIDEMQDPGRYSRNSDVFWGDKAVRYLPSFRVGTLEEGLRFAFEASPRICFEMNGRQLPFGCHAWARYDRKFWEPYLVGSSVPLPHPAAPAAVV